MTTRDHDLGAVAQGATPSDELVRSHARLRLLAEVSRAFAELAPGYQSLVQKVARAMADCVGDGCLIMLRDANREGLIKAADAHRDPILEADCNVLEANIGRWPITGNSLPAMVARSGVPMLASVVRPEIVVARVDNVIKPLAARLNIHSLVVVPIRARSQTLGSLALVRSRPGDSYTADDLTLVQELADRAGLAIENSRLYEEARERAAELKAANEVLRQHATLVEGIADAVVWTDAQQTIRGWNPGAEKLFGWSAREALGVHAPDLLSTEPQDAARAQLLRQLLADGHWSGERQLRRKDGSHVLVLVSAAALTDQQGKMVGLLSIIRDISEQREAENAARRLASLVESSDDAVQSIGLDGIVQSWNRAAERLYGYSAAEAIGRHISFIVPGKSSEQEQRIAQIRRGERVASFEALRKRKDGSLVEVSLTISPVFDHAGRVSAISGIARDITEKRRLERELLSAERMASVGMLAAGIAHEINNPLTYVLGNLEVVLAELSALARADSAPLHEPIAMLRDAHDGAERIARIVRGLKTYSRTDAEPHVPLALQQVLETAERLAQSELKHCAQVLKEYEDTPQVRGDEGALVQVFVNLLVNAAQALPGDGRVHNEVRIRTRTDDAGGAVVEISDTGPGIPPEIQARIFDPFVTTKPAGEGTGLGLSICRRIVVTHGGSISFESVSGIGTTFRVQLPAADAAARVAAPEPIRADAPSKRRGKILVVDDDPIIGDLLARILGAEHDVVVCRGGRAALDRIHAGESFDTILCDLMMPELSGMDVHAALKVTSPAQAAHMVFLTGGSFTLQSREFLESVTNPRLSKPFNAGEVRLLVRELMA